MIKEHSLVLKGNLSQRYLDLMGRVKQGTWTSGTTKTKKTVEVLLQGWVQRVGCYVRVEEEKYLVMELMNQECESKYVRKKKQKLCQNLVMKNIFKDVALE